MARAWFGGRQGLRFGATSRLYAAVATLGLARGVWAHNSTLAGAALVVLAGVVAFVLFDALTPDAVSGPGADT